MQTNPNNHSKNYLDLSKNTHKTHSNRPLNRATTANHYTNTHHTGPSKSLLIIGAFCFSIILGSVAYKIALAHKNSSAGTLENNNLAMVASQDSQNSATDTNTLINNALQEAQISSLTDQNSTSSNPFAITPTDSASNRVAKSLFVGYMNAQQSTADTGNTSDTLTDDQATNVAGTVISELNNRDLPQPQYSIADVKSYIPSNTDQIKQYGNVVAGIILQNYKIIANDKTKSSNDLQPMEDVYINIGKTLIKQSVPDGVKNEHLELVNSFLILADGMKMIEKQSTDPVQALLGVRVLQNVSTEQQNVLISIAKYFESNAIIFTSSDVGALWEDYKKLPFVTPAEISTGNTDSTQQSDATTGQ
jgi:hypothetical protein